jgi:membrane-associated phospholipid phosphatase
LKEDGLIALERKLFYIINHDWSNSFFDTVMPVLRESLIWVPLYFFLMLLGWYNFGRKGLWWILVGIATAALSNFISSDIIKNMTDKVRPCRDALLDPAAHVLVKYCPQSSSFTSSHAVNHFAMATFFFMTLRGSTRYAWLFFVWAFAIIYAQVYVGVHYPFDVLAGALLGCSIGYMAATLFHYRAGFLHDHFVHQNPPNV